MAEDLARVTSKKNLREATEALTKAAEAFVDARYGKAHDHAQEAKGLSPRDATIRELLGLSAYRLGRWETALRELRTFRRFTGESTHLPVEMDALRALGRLDDVRAAWTLLQRIKGRRDTMNEGRVVYGSFLLDEGDAAGAWKVTGPSRITADVDESALRVWYVAARAAARLDDLTTARRLLEAIERADPAFPGLDDLERALGG